MHLHKLAVINDHLISSLLTYVDQNTSSHAKHGYDVPIYLDHSGSCAQLLVGSSERTNEYYDNSGNIIFKLPFDRFI